MITISTYIHFTKEQREQARQTDLANFLINQGEKVKKSGSEYEWLDGSQKVTIRGYLWYHQYEQKGGDVEARTIVACLVQAADAISAARPGARRENVENYIKRLQKLEEVASSFDGVERTFAIQAGREVRVMVKPEIVNDERMIPLARDICKKIEEELEYPGQIKVNIIRESRASDFAK